MIRRCAKTSTPCFVHTLKRIAVVVGLLIAATAFAQSPVEWTGEFVPNRVIVKFRPEATAGKAARIRSDMRAQLNGTMAQRLDLIDAEVWDLPGQDVQKVVAQWKDDPRVEFIEPDYIVRASVVPNDASFGSLYGMTKIQAPQAWDSTTGTDVLIGVIDTGVDYNHPDLAANIWTNPGEIAGNSIDDDGNGYVDDIHGYDFINNDGDPMDDHNHGTHVSGTIAGVGNNGVGVAGVNWTARIMALKFLGASGSGPTSGAILAVQYATQMGARLTNNSWGGGGYSQALYNAIQAAGAANQLFVAAAGNDGSGEASYPALYDLENIISVAATDANDLKASFSQYNAVSVDLGAPGVGILSTTRGNTYSSFNGTSMATPHVAGVAGLVWAFRPALTAEDVKAIVLSTVDPVASMNGRTVTGGRLNAFRAIAATTGWVPLAAPDIAVSPASFSVTLDPDASTTEVLSISNAAGARTLYWSITAPACSWLTLNKLSGRVVAGATEQIQVGISAFGLVPGDVHCDIEVTSNDPDESPVQVGVDLHVNFLPPPQASVTPLALAFSMNTGELASRTVDVSNTSGPGTRNLHWSAVREGASAWLSLQNASGTTAPGTTGTFTVSVNSAGVATGSYRDTIRVTTNDSNLPQVRIPVALSVNSPPVLGQKIYTFSGDPVNIYRANLDGTGASTPFTNVRRPIAGEVDEVNRKLYWIDWTPDPRIYRADLNGLNQELLLSGLATPVTMVLDVPNNHMYFFGQVAGQVYRLSRADLDGQNLTTIGDVPGWNFSGLSLDPVNRKLYWIHLGANNDLAETGIFRSNLDLTNKEHLVTPAAVAIRGLSLDLTGRLMYWGESYPRDVIRKATLDGLNQSDVLEGYEALDVAVDPAGGKVYWTQQLGSYPNLYYDTRRANVVGAPDIQSLGIPGFRIALDLSPDVDPATLPTAVATSPNVTTLGSTSQIIRVRYNDDVGVNTTTLSDGDLSVVGPGGAIGVTFLDFSVDPPVAGQSTATGSGTNGASTGPITARYSMVPPGGTWDMADAGTYHINMVAGEVSDVDATAHAVPAGEIGTFSAFALISVDVTTTPSGLSISVDDTTYTSPHTFAWTPGSSHTIATPSPQSLVAGTQYAFLNWSDAGADSHSIEPGAPTTFNATFKTQYLLTTVLTPFDGGTITPVSGYFDAGATIPVNATPNSGFAFDGFTGAVTGTTNPTSFVLTGPATVTANFRRPLIPAVIDNRIAVGSDDAEESSSDFVSVDGSDLELVLDGSLQTVGLRFRNLAIPRGAVITSAYVQFQADEAQSAATALTIQAHAIDNAPTFFGTVRNISNRARAPIAAPWSPAAWSVIGAAGTAQRTPELKDVIQQIINRPGWASGNALALILTGTGHRTAESYEGLKTGAPLLHLEFTIGADFNRAPVVNAGPDQTITLPSTALLDGTVSDDGLINPPGSVTTEWEQVGGAGVASFVNRFSVDTQVSFSGAGNYVLRLSANDGALTTRDSVTINVLGASALTVERRVTSGSDDAEESSAGSVSVTGSDLELVNDGNLQTVGLRFPNLAIPNGASIVNAWVQFQADEAQSEATALTIKGQVGNAAAFTSATRNVSQRPRTTASAAWAPAAWNTVGQAGAAQRTSELKDVVQEIVSGGGWASGNALALIITGTGHRTAESFEGLPGGAALLHIEYNTALPVNQAPTVDAGPARVVTLPAAAQLDGTVADDGIPTPATPAVTWTVDSGPIGGIVAFANANAVDTQASFNLAGSYVVRLTANDGLAFASDTTRVTVLPTGTVVTFETRVAAGSDDAEEAGAGGVSVTSSDLELVNDGSLQTVGVRFRGVSIPRGSVINNAWVQFQSDEAQSEATALTIQGEASDNAAIYTGASRSISTRARTVESVAWTPAAWNVLDVAGADQRTPNLAVLVQKAVSRGGWASGNALAFVITGTGHRTAEAFEGLASAAPLLHVEYTTPSAIAVNEAEQLASSRVEVSFGPTTARIVPNPLRDRGTIDLALGRSGAVRIELFDVQGRRLRTLLDERTLAAGRHQIELGARLTPGLYFYRVEAPDRRFNGRVMVLE